MCFKFSLSLNYEFSSLVLNSFYFYGMTLILMNTKPTHNEDLIQSAYDREYTTLFVSVIHLYLDVIKQTQSEHVFVSLHGA